MKKFIVMLAFAAFITTGTQGISFAEGYGPMDNQMHGQYNKEGHNPGMELRQKLNLTEEQAQKAKEMREASRAKIKPLIDEMRAERAKFREMTQNNAPQDQIDAQKQKIKELMMRVREVHRQNLGNFEQILTPDQKTQFQEFKKQRKERMKDRKAKMHERYKQEKRMLKEENKK